MRVDGICLLVRHISADPKPAGPRRVETRVPGYEGNFDFVGVIINIGNFSARAQESIKWEKWVTALRPLIDRGKVVKLIFLWRTNLFDCLRLVK